MLVRYTKTSDTTGEFTVFDGKSYSGKVTLDGEQFRVEYVAPPNHTVSPRVREDLDPYIIDHVIKEHFQ